MKARWTLLVFCLILLIPLMTPTSSFYVKAQASTVSSVFISPVSTCCSLGAPIPVQAVITLSVMLNLTAGQGFNGFDVRLNYTSPTSASNSGTMQAQSISYSGNVFAGKSPRVLAECIDGIGYITGGGGCAPDDYQAPGQIHFAEVSVGPALKGPLSSALLFSISFKIAGNGTSLVYFDRSNLVNPNPDPSNPQVINPVYVPLVAYAGIFGNNGLVAFFNFSPSDPTVSVSVLPRQPAIFDATGSVDAYNDSLALTRYSWNFGDGTPVQNTPAVTQHYFVAPGNYSVRLDVADSSGRTGSITRNVPVVPALGSLALTFKDQIGTLLRGNVIVKMFNSSIATLPFTNKTIDQGGQAQFNRLAPGTYQVTFSGQGIVPSSRSELITPGWTTQDTVYLTVQTPPPDYSWLVFVGPMAGGLGVVAVVAVMKRRNSDKGPRSSKRSSGGFKKR